MDQRPFQRLARPRRVEIDNLPADLMAFYSENEGVGLESSPDRLVRLCQLNEVAAITWSDLHIFGKDPVAGWESFRGLRIGVSSFFDDIVYATSSPSCSAGSILAFGVEVMGPGGTGPNRFECSLVLADAFSTWLKRLEQHNWKEYGLVPSEIQRLRSRIQREQLAYYQSLNPGIEWEELLEKPWWKFW